MADSMNLLTAQITFLEPHLALIHIPIKLYPLCLQPILRLLFGEDHDEDAAHISWTNRHDFLNVSITPVECSVICSRHLADRFLRPVADVLNGLYASATTTPDPKTRIQISTEDYIVIQVDGQGLDAGQRVLELTSPLAMAGISIFFITTYFSDYILVPYRARRTVTKALQQRGFVFSRTADAFVSQLSPSSPTTPHGGRQFTSSPFWDPSTSTSTSSPAPTTPPAKDIPELQLRTFMRLKRNNIQPLVDGDIRLANCAGSREGDAHSEERLKNDLLQVLLSTASLPATSTSTTRKPVETIPGLLSSAFPHDDDDNNDDGGGAAVTSDIDMDTSTSTTIDHGAKFLSLTITAGEPISILLEHRLLERLGASLLGAKSPDDALVPITLDLRDLPLEATGIVCGVAGRLAHGSTDGDEHAELKVRPQMTTPGDDGNGIGNGNGSGNGNGIRGTTAAEGESIDISFLSTARAGTVIVRASQLQKALDALEYGMKRAADVPL